MSRSRNIKPGFFMDDEMFHVGPDTKLLFVGLWTLADRLGILENRPARIGASIYPSHHLGTALEVDRMIAELQKLGKITIYTHETKSLIYINNFAKHQNPHPGEKDFGFPMPQQLNLITSRDNAISAKKQGIEKLNCQQLNYTASPDESCIPLNESCSMKHESSGQGPEAFAVEKSIYEFFKATVKAQALSHWTASKGKIIRAALNKGHTTEAIKSAIFNFSLDDWPMRPKYSDISQCLGVKDGEDLVIKWLNAKPIPQHPRREDGKVIPEMKPVVISQKSIDAYRDALDGGNKNAG